MQRWALPIGVVLVTLVTFSPVVTFPVLLWDDYTNLSAIPWSYAIDWSDLSWIVTTHVMGHRVPLTWVSYALDFLLWGGRPAGFHATNLAWHAVNAILIYLIARRLLVGTGASTSVIRAGAATAALAFAIHPLRAESVAWITERRDVLACAGFLAAVLAYLRAVERTGARYWRWLGVSLLAFCGSLLAKQMMLTTPAVLLILDAYPLRRLHRPYWPVVREKLLFGIPALGGAALLASTMAGDVGFTPVAEFTLNARLAMFVYGAMFYPVQTFLPIAVSPMHEIPANPSLLAPAFAASLIAFCAVTAAAVTLRRRAPWFTAVWAYSVVTILPVSGLLFAPGTNLVSDRYTYFCALGWPLLLGAVVVTAARRAPARARLVSGLAVVVLLAWMALTWREVWIWRSDESLWEAAVVRNPDCGKCRAHLSLQLANAGRIIDAELEARAAVRVRPDVGQNHAILGHVLEQQGRVDEAATAFSKASARDPAYTGDFRRAHGRILAARNRLRESAAAVRAAYWLAPSEQNAIALKQVLVALADEHDRSGHSADAARVRDEISVLTRSVPALLAAERSAAGPASAP